MDGHQTRRRVLIFDPIPAQIEGVILEITSLIVCCYHIAMATALPRPSRPSNGPPNMALPALPVNKTRKTTGSYSPTKSAPSTPRSGLRAPSTSFAPPSPAPTSALPQPKLGPGINAAGKTLRKTVSINSFPHPPRGDSRSSSLPPSPLTSEKPRSRKSRAPKEYTFSPATPSLLNGSGEGKSISNARMSDGLISISSPPHSRSSSAQDSYSTSATTYDDPAEATTSNGVDGANGAATSASEKRTSKSDGKGNVVVSVRVRPDNQSPESRPEGEWMVDGRKSLIAYKGKEGGDHYYGKNRRAPLLKDGRVNLPYQTNLGC